MSYSFPCLGHRPITTHVPRYVRDERRRASVAAVVGTALLVRSVVALVQRGQRPLGAFVVRVRPRFELSTGVGVGPDVDVLPTLLGHDAVDDANLGVVG